MPKQERPAREEIIDIGRRLYALRLVVSKAGNISARIDGDNLLITSTGSCLGDLRMDDIIKVSLNEGFENDKRLSTEFPLHCLIYKNFHPQAVIHCHPPLVNGYFYVHTQLDVLTFETRLYLGRVPVVEQSTPSITQPELVLDALKVNNLVVVRRHGVVSIGQSLTEALHSIETLEEAVKVAAVARLFKKDHLDEFERELKESLTEEGSVYPIFSESHINKIVDLVNRDEFIAQQGQDLDLTLQLAIRLDGDKRVYKFNFEKGRITKLEFDEEAPFVISAPLDVWRLVFLGKLDPFVAVTQGRMKLKGELGKLSRWYVPFSRLFELFKQVRIK